MNEAIRMQAFLSALGAIRSIGTSADLREISRELVERYGLDSRTAGAEMYRLVASADAQWRAGQGAADSPNTTLPRSQMPYDPSLTEGSGLIHYRIVVVSSDGASNIVSVYTTNPVSGSEAIGMAIEIVQSGFVPRTTQPGKYGGDQGVTFAGHVVTIGRAR